MATNVSRVISGCSAGPPMMNGITAMTATARTLTPVKPVAVRLHRLTGTNVAEGLRAAGADRRVPLHPAAPCPAASRTTWRLVNSPPGRTVSTARNSRLTARTA